MCKYYATSPISLIYRRTTVGLFLYYDVFVHLASICVLCWHWCKRKSLIIHLYFNNKTIFEQFKYATHVQYTALRRTAINTHSYAIYAIFRISVNFFFYFLFFLITIFPSWTDGFLFKRLEAVKVSSKK